MMQAILQEYFYEIFLTINNLQLEFDQFIYHVAIG